MRLLMVGPWRMVAMRRHIDWAVESGIEVCVADFPSDYTLVVPTRFRVTSLSPRSAVAIGQGQTHKRSERSLQAAGLRLQHLAATFQPDVIHSYRLTEHTDLCLRAGLQPLVVSVWGFLNRLLAADASKKDLRWIRRLRAGAHTLLVESPNLLEALARHAIAPLRMDCFPIGVDGDLFHPGYQEKVAAWRFALDIPAEATVLLSPRGWAQGYGQQHIMRAFAEAYHRLDRPLVLALMSLGRMKQPEALAREVHDLGVSLGVGHAIRWIPQVPYEDMPGIYALADIVINYPMGDAFPSTLLEAAACARPVITSDLPAYRNTFVQRFFRLVEPENPAALADALVEMAAGSSASWATNVEHARQAVLEEHEESIQKRRLLSLYHRIVAQRRPERHLTNLITYDKIDLMGA